MKLEAKELLISYEKPHKPVTSDTVFRWIKDELSCGGVHISACKVYSVGSASSSKARDC